MKKYKNFYLENIIKDFKDFCASADEFIEKQKELQKKIDESRNKKEYA